MKKKHYKILKEEIDLEIGKLPNCCSNECPFCCFQPIEIFEFEKESIKKAIQKLDDKTKETIKNSLESWFNLLNKNITGNIIPEGDDILKTFQSMLPNRHQCPLLINKSCSIYNDRPIACRTHIVENEVLNCIENPYRFPSEASSKIKFDKLLDLVKKHGRQERFSLSYIVAEVIPISTPIKPLAQKWMFG